MSEAASTSVRLWRGFIDAAAVGCERLWARVSPPRQLRLVELDRGRFAADADAGAEAAWLDNDGALLANNLAMLDAARGARVELKLRADRFLVRDVPLPAQAGGFLDRILRAQIDRWTPWPAARAAFGYALREQSGDKILVTFAAGDLLELRPIFDAFLALRPRTLDIAVETGPGLPRIMLAREGVGAQGGEALRKWLGGALIAGSVSVLAALAYASWQGAGLDAEYETLQAELAAKRGGLPQADPARDAERRIIARKATSPTALAALEELTRALPDDTYATDVELAGTKLRVIGVSGNATALIERIEQSPILSDANFFAPTTRGANDAGEQFHIEATIGAEKGQNP